MPRRELHPQMRAQICELSSIHWSPGRTHRLYPTIPFSTIKSIIKSASSQVDFKTKPRSSWPRTLTEEQHDHVYDIVNHVNPYIKMRDLLHEVYSVVKKRSLEGLLQKMNKKKWMQIKRPAITQDHASSRLAWACDHEHYTLED